MQMQQPAQLRCKRPRVARLRALLGVVLDLRREVIAHEAQVLAGSVVVGLIFVLFAGRREAVLDNCGHVV